MRRTIEKYILRAAVRAIDPSFRSPAKAPAKNRATFARKKAEARGERGVGEETTEKRGWKREFCATWQRGRGIVPEKRCTCTRRCSLASQPPSPTNPLRRRPRRETPGSAGDDLERAKFRIFAGAFFTKDAVRSREAAWLPDKREKHAVACVSREQCNCALLGERRRECPEVN